MKQTKIAEPAERTEAAIVEDIAGESERLLSAEQEVAGFQDRRARLVATGLAVIADRAVNVEVSGCGLRRTRR